MPALRIEIEVSVGADGSGKVRVPSQVKCTQFKSANYESHRVQYRFSQNFTVWAEPSASHKQLPRVCWQAVCMPCCSAPMRVTDLERPVGSAAVLAPCAPFLCPISAGPHPSEQHALPNAGRNHRLYLQCLRYRASPLMRLLRSDVSECARV